MRPNETLHSQLSAFVDDELPAAETDLFVRRLARDADLKQAMSRYQLMGEVLRAPMVKTQLSCDFSTRITAALDREDGAVAVPAAAAPKLPVGRWLKPAAGLAVAASVAWVAVLAVRPQPATLNAENLSAEEILQPVEVTAQKMVAANSYVVPVVSDAPSAPIPATRLTNYVVAHSEFSSPLGRRNMMTGLLASEQAVSYEQPVEADLVSGR